MGHYEDSSLNAEKSLYGTINTSIQTSENLEISFTFSKWSPDKKTNIFDKGSPLHSYGPDN